MMLELGKNRTDLVSMYDQQMKNSMKLLMCLLTATPQS